MATWKVQAGDPPRDNLIGSPPAAETTVAAWPDGTQAFIDQRSAAQPGIDWYLIWVSGDPQTDAA